MSLIEVLFGQPKPVEPKPERPQAIAAQEAPHTVCAMVSGTLVPMPELPDPIFASGAMGPTVGIKPSGGTVYSPVTGTVTLTTKTLHAVGLTSDDGVEVLIHLGVDTVDLRGVVFTGFVSEGQHVRAGEPLVVCDLDRIAQAGYSDVAIVVVTNANMFDEVSCVSAGEVKAGEPVMVAHS